jgi:hypothetical protein
MLQLEERDPAVGVGTASALSENIKR